MRIVAFILSALVFTSCQRSNNFLRSNGMKKHIVIQPLNGFDKKEDTALLHFIRNQVLAFYNRDVIVAKPLNMRASFINTEKGTRYSADLILKFLAAQKNDTVATIIGITHEDIFTTIRDGSGNIQQPEYKYKVWGIFGLGYEPGVACVVSDHRLRINNKQVYNHRIRTVVLHEICHNLGLPHCPTRGCIMSDANEKIATVDNSGNDYCEACKKQLDIQPGISK